MSNLDQTKLFGNKTVCYEECISLHPNEYFHCIKLEVFIEFKYSKWDFKTVKKEHMENETKTVKHMKYEIECTTQTA